MNTLAAVVTSYMGVASAAAVDPLHVDGLIAAIVTPMHANSSVNYQAVPLQAAYLQETHVSHVFVGGTTGEGYSLSVDERMALVEAWEESLPTYGVNYIVHVGAESVVDMIKLTQHAVEHGAEAVGVMPPVFFKPGTIEALGQWVEVAASHAPSLPVYYYHIPEATGVSFNMLVSWCMCMCGAVRCVPAW